PNALSTLDRILPTQFAICPLVENARPRVGEALGRGIRGDHCPIGQLRDLPENVRFLAALIDPSEATIDEDGAFVVRPAVRVFLIGIHDLSLRRRAKRHRAHPSTCPIAFASDQFFPWGTPLDGGGLPC